jgi:hypothetical protein
VGAKGGRGQSGNGYVDEGWEVEIGIAVGIEIVFELKLVESIVVTREI